jgi:hypothetical protein
MHTNGREVWAAHLQSLSASFEGSMLAEIADTDLRALNGKDAAATFVARKRFLGLVNNVKRLSTAITALRMVTVVIKSGVVQPEETLVDMVMNSVSTKLTRERPSTHSAPPRRWSCKYCNVCRRADLNSANVR